MFKQDIYYSIDYNTLYIIYIIYHINLKPGYINRQGVGLSILHFHRSLVA